MIVSRVLLATILCLLIANCNRARTQVQDDSRLADDDAQTPVDQPEDNALDDNDQPENIEGLAAWAGSWRGTCTPNNYNTDNVNDPYPIVLKVGTESEGRILWTIQYPPERAREYTMIKQNDLEGHYILDENNGLMIDRFYDGNELVDFYSISNGRAFQSSMRKVGDRILARFSSWWANPIRVTQLTGNPEFVVRAFAVRDLTSCVLSRVAD